MPMQPTPEQSAVLDAFQTGGHVTVQAGAGTGKTSTLTLLAHKSPNQRGLYIAYNKALAEEAKGKFPRNVTCKTAHSLAFGHALRDRLNGPRMGAQQSARILRINEPVRVAEDKMLAPAQLARIALETVQRFCYSADPEPARRHVPAVNGITTTEARNALVDAVVPLARRAWADLTSPRGELKYQHDHYLKAWALSEPTLPFDFLMLDEAQDSNPVIAKVFGDQRGQKVVVGDSMQQLYAWRGAVDAMATFPADHTLFLTQSFRFGQAVADEANKWLTILNADLRLKGNPGLDTRLGSLTYATTNAVLCRSNAEAVATVLSCHEANLAVALVGGGQDVKRLAEAAMDLKNGRPTSHPELFLFQTWGEVQQYVEEAADGSDLAVAVKLIDTYGAPEVVRAIDRTVDERYAQVTVSTAHKSKGREWHNVLVASDFHEPVSDGQVQEADQADAMLAYVTVTRAQSILDRTGLAWVDRQPALLGRTVTAGPVDEVTHVLTAPTPVCGAEHSAYLNVRCTEPAGHDGLHEAPGVQPWGQALTRVA